MSPAADYRGVDTPPSFGWSTVYLVTPGVAGVGIAGCCFAATSTAVSHEPNRAHSSALGAGSAGRSQLRPLGTPRSRGRSRPRRRASQRPTRGNTPASARLACGERFADRLLPGPAPRDGAAKIRARPERRPLVPARHMTALRVPRSDGAMVCVRMPQLPAAQPNKATPPRTG
jgi:hypothetical protein